MLLLLSPMLWAEVVTLRTGQSIKGEILLQNDEVVIIRAKNGTRYQYPKSEILTIKHDDASQEATTDTASVVKATRPVNLRFQAHGGVVCVPTMGVGGQVGADFMVGSYAIQGKRMFVGGGVGYRAKWVGGKTYSLIPLQAIVDIPLTTTQHAPILGMSIGYGFSTNKATQGGMCVGANVGWSYLFNKRCCLALSLLAEWQQATTDMIDIVQDPLTGIATQYTNHRGCNFISVGMKLAVSF